MTQPHTSLVLNEQRAGDTRGLATGVLGSTETERVYAKAARSTVLLDVTASFVGRAGEPIARRSSSAGVVLTDTGDILTTAHSIFGETALQVTLPDGTAMPGTVVGVLAQDDLALIHVRYPSGLTTPTWAAKSTLRIGQALMALGAAGGETSSTALVTGVLSALDRTAATETVTLGGLLLMDAPISHGYSGGPVVDASGRIIGINAAVAQDADGAQIPGLAFAIPAETALRLVPQLERSSPTAPRQPSLGIQVSGSAGDAIVDQVDQAGAGEVAGIAVGDRITAWDHTPVRSAEALNADVQASAPGSSHHLTFDRGQSETTKTVHVGDANSPR